MTASREARASRETLLRVYDALHLLGPVITKRAWVQQFQRPLLETGRLNAATRAWERFKAALAASGLPYERHLDPDPQLLGAAEDSHHLVPEVYLLLRCRTELELLLYDPLEGLVAELEELGCQGSRRDRRRQRCRFADGGQRCQKRATRDTYYTCEEHR